MVNFSLLDSWIREQMESRNTPALVLSLTDRTHNVHTAQFGHADPGAQVALCAGHLFEIGSIGKTFTAIAVLQAVEKGLLDLQIPVVEYLPWFEVSSKFGPITSHHLLTHSAGLIEGTDFSADARSEVWALRKSETGFAPGERFYYSNAGYKALGLLLEAVTGQPYPQLIRSGILQPLGMNDTAAQITHRIRPLLAQGCMPLFDDRPSHRSHPLVPAPWLETDTADGSIASTAADMAKFMRMLLNRGQGFNARLLSQESFDLLIHPHIDQDEDWSYGYGLNVFDHEGYAHTGHAGDMPGYEAYMWLDIDNGLGSTILMTHPHVPGISLTTLDYLRKLVREEPLPDLEPPADPLHLAAVDPSIYAGKYTLANREELSLLPAGVRDFDTPENLVLVSEGDSLLLEYSGELIALEERGDDCFYINHPDFDRFLLKFGTQQTPSGETSVVEAFHGSKWYTSKSYSGEFEFDFPAEWLAYPGHYRAFNPWETNFRIVLRKDHLLYVTPAGDETRLYPLGEGLFRIGEAPSPERMRFDQVLDGMTLRVNRSGCDYYRFFTP
jgi:CubicO group peptidase (beta-lactamase class C family)